MLAGCGEIVQPPSEDAAPDAAPVQDRVLARTDDAGAPEVTVQDASPAPDAHVEAADAEPHDARAPEAATPCGELNEPCCNGTCGRDLQCNGPFCVGNGCGQEDAVCCSDGTCGPGLWCTEGNCHPCGQPGEPCCNITQILPTDGGWSYPGATCATGTCSLSGNC